MSIKNKVLIIFLIINLCVKDLQTKQYSAYKKSAYEDPADEDEYFAYENFAYEDPVDEDSLNEQEEALKMELIALEEESQQPSNIVNDVGAIVRSSAQGYINAGKALGRGISSILPWNWNKHSENFEPYKRKIGE